MKTSTKFATLAFAAANLIALAAAPALAQAVGGSKCSTIREMDKKTQCLTRATDQMLEEESKLKRDNKRVNSFIGANPPKTTTDVITNSGPVTVYDGVNSKGQGYRIVVGSTGVAASGSASKITGSGPRGSRR